MAILHGDADRERGAGAGARRHRPVRRRPSCPCTPTRPFGGWKASGFGPPEHGRWDAEFLTRPQAVYDA